MTRYAKRLLCRLLIGVLLFTQMAIASYACPQLSSLGGADSFVALADASGSRNSQADSDSALASTQSAMPDDTMAASCDIMYQPDPDNPNLCAEHARFGQQSGQTQTPTVPALLLASLYVVSAAPELTVPTRPAVDSASVLAAASPPHAILHCCFRI